MISIVSPLANAYHIVERGEVIEEGKTSVGLLITSYQ